MRRFLFAAIGAASFALVPGSAHAQAVPQTTIQVPQGVFVRNVAVAGTSKVVIGNSSTVKGATASAPVIVSNTGSVLTQLGTFTHVNGSISSVAPVWLAAGATVSGSVSTTSAPLALPGQITGPVSTTATLTPPLPYAWDLPSLPSNGDVHLSFLANGALTPGGYGQVNVDAGSTLTLTAGTYTADRFHIDPLGFVKFDTSAGPIQLYVATAMDIFTGVTLIGSPSNLLLVYAGPNKVTINSPFNGTVVAPNAVIELESVGLPYNYVGSFFASEVDVDPNITLTQAAFNWDTIPQLAGTNGNAIASVPGTVFTPGTHADTAPNMSATFHSTGTGTGYYDHLHLLTSGPGVVPAKFCDANGNVVATPTDTQLNTAPPITSTCPAAPAASEDACAIDPATVTTVCTTDADCTGGSICGVHCLDTSCSTTEHRCGKQPASCGGIPAATSCQQYTLCPRPGATGTTNPAQIAAQLAPTTAPGPNGTVKPVDQDTVPPTYSTLTAGLCADAASLPATMKDGSNKPTNDGSSEWGVYITPSTDFGVTPVKTSSGIGELSDLHATGNVDFGGIIFGKKISVVSANLGVVATDCGLNFTSVIKLFGDAVVSFTPSAANKLHFATSGNNSLGTPSGNTGACNSAKAANVAALADVRKSNVFAREVIQYYNTNKMTTELCTSIQQNVKNPPAGINCNDVDGMTVSQKLSVLNAWQTEYNDKTSNWPTMANNLAVARQAVSTTGTITIFNAAHAYHVKIFDVPIPIAFFTLDLVAEGYGSWNVAGGFQYGLGIDGQILSLVQNGLKGELPSSGDIRVYAGPVITPSVAIGVLGFAGVGIPGVSIGIEGKVDLLDAQLPTGVLAAALRISEPDTRNLSASDYAGTPVAGLSPTDYRWVVGSKWGSDLQLSELSGEMDVAVRVSLLFFSDDFHVKLFGWNGFSQHFNLIGGGAGSPLVYANDFGRTGDSMAYTAIAPITGTPLTAHPVPAVPFPTCVGSPPR